MHMTITSWEQLKALSAEDKAKVTSLTLAPGLPTPNSLAGSFSDFENMKTIDLSQLDFHGVKEVMYMFHHCRKLDTMIVQHDFYEATQYLLMEYRPMQFAPIWGMGQAGFNYLGLDGSPLSIKPI